MDRDAPMPHSPPMPTPYRVRSTSSMASDVENPVRNSINE